MVGSISLLQRHCSTCQTPQTSLDGDIILLHRWPLGKDRTEKGLPPETLALIQPLMSRGFPRAMEVIETCWTLKNCVGSVDLFGNTKSLGYDTLLVDKELSMPSSIG
jgi:hypothetical protein